MNFEIELIYYYGNSWPTVQIENSVISETVIDKSTKNIVILINDVSDELVLTKTGKTDSDTVVENNIIVRDQFIEIKSIRADNILLDLNLIKDHCVFTPAYSQGYYDYCQKHNQEIEPTINTFNLYFNGVWKFQFENPFWSWYADLRKQSDLKYFSSDFIEKYIGNNHSEHQELMTKLKQLLNV